MARKTDEDTGIIYSIDEQPPLGESITVSVQHIITMLPANIAGPLLIAGAVGLATGQVTYLVQMALIFAGLSTIVQAIPIGPIGARLPIVMGTSLTFVGGLISIITQYSLAAAFGASIFAALVGAFIGWKFEWFERYFTPLVNGVIVSIIGLYLIPIGMDYVAGGAGAADYGAPVNLALGTLVFIIAILLNQLSTGYGRMFSLLAAILVGYIIAFFMGMVDFSSVAEAGWFALPIPLKFGVAFKPIPILIISILYVTTSIENIGHVSALTALVDRTPTLREYRGGLMADGLMSSFGSVFGAFPNTSYAQNIGVVVFTGVMSRYIIAIGGGIIMILGFVPKIGALFATIPDPVLGGVTLVMFGMVLSNGLLIIKEEVPLTQRNMVIIAAAISAGLAVSNRPDALSQLPEQVQMFVGEAVVVTAVVVLALDILVPRAEAKRKSRTQSSREAETASDSLTED